MSGGIPHRQADILREYLPGTLNSYSHGTCTDSNLCLHSHFLSPSGHLLNIPLDLPSLGMFLLMTHMVVEEAVCVSKVRSYPCKCVGIEGECLHHNHYSLEF